MSRFKLFSLITAMMASISNNESLSAKEKSKQINSLSMGNSNGHLQWAPISWQKIKPAPDPQTQEAKPAFNKMELINCTTN